MILFFDRSMGTGIPKALKEYLKPPRIDIEWHELYFDQAEHDDIWLPQVGSWGWTVIGQDHMYHERTAELDALRTHSIGAFYLWGAEHPKWETLRVFARAYDNILAKADVTPRPFVFRIAKHGALTEIPI